MSKVKQPKKAVKVEQPKKTRDDEVTAAVQSLREFHRVGKTVSAGEYGDAVIDKAAAENEINPDTMRKARQFADPEKGYSKAELDHLCKTIVDLQAGQEIRQPVFGQSHVIRILSVPKSKRSALQKQAIEKAWSLSQLEVAIKRRFGTRRAGGRRRRVAKDPIGLLSELESSCETWRRLVEAVERGVPQVLAELPDELQGELKLVTKRLLSFQGKVEDELDRRVPTRIKRPKPRPERAGKQPLFGNKKGEIWTVF